MLFGRPLIDRLKTDLASEKRYIKSYSNENKRLQAHVLDLEEELQRAQKEAEQALNEA